MRAESKTRLSITVTLVVSVVFSVQVKGDTGAVKRLFSPASRDPSHGFEPDNRRSKSGRGIEMDTEGMVSKDGSFSEHTHHAPVSPLAAALCTEHPRGNA
jgi:hypothetical protein